MKAAAKTKKTPKTKAAPKLFRVMVTQVETTTRSAYVLAMSRDDAGRIAKDQDISMQQDDDTVCVLSVAVERRIDTVKEVEADWRQSEAYESEGFQAFVKHRGDDVRWGNGMIVEDCFETSPFVHSPNEEQSKPSTR